MITGTRVMNLTIDEGGVPPHIKPLLASIVSAIERGNWGEVVHSSCTAQELEEAQDDLAEALEESEASLQDVKETGWDLVEEVENFCKSAEVVAVTMALKKAYEAVSVQVSEQGMDDDDPTDNKELLEEIKQADMDFDRVLKELKTYANDESKYFQD